MAEAETGPSAGEMSFSHGLYNNGAILLVGINPATPFSALAHLNTREHRLYRLFCVLTAHPETKEHAVLVSHPTPALVYACGQLDNDGTAHVYWLEALQKSDLLKDACKKLAL